MASHNATQTAIEIRRTRDRTRTALQTPIAAPMYCVLYMKERKEHQSAWFYRRDHARRALQIIQRRYGEKNAIIYLD